MQKIKQISTTMFASLSVRNYRLYFTGQAISLSGTWMQTIGQTWLVLKITGSGTALGLVTALQFLPILFLGPWGGLIADRFSKRRILYVTQTVSAILALILGVLVLTNTVQLWMIDILAFSLGLVNTIDNPTRQAFVMEMVGKDKLTNAVSLNSAEVNLARVIGPGLGGLLIATLGMAPLFLVNGISFAAVIIIIYMMNPLELFAAPVVPRAKGQLREGFKYVWSTPVLKNELIMMAVIGTLSYEFTALLPLFAQFTFRGNAGTFAALTSAMGVGAVIGGLFIANRKQAAPHMLIVAAFLFGFSILLAAFAPTLTLALFAMVVVGFFSISFTALGNIVLQLESDAAMRGRVMALWTVAFLGSTPIGGPIIGWIGEHFGARWGLAVGGFAAIAAGGCGTITLRQHNTKAISQEIGISNTDEMNRDKRIL